MALVRPPRYGVDERRERRRKEFAMVHLSRGARRALLAALLAASCPWAVVAATTPGEP